MKRLLNIIFGRAFAYTLCIALEIYWFVLLILRLKEYYVWFSALVGILAIVFALHVNDSRKNPAYKLVWTFVILSVPILGVFLYLFIGQASSVKKIKKKSLKLVDEYGKYKKDDSELIEKLSIERPEIAGQLKYISNYSGFGAYNNSDCYFLSETSEALSKMKEELKKAEKYIFMEYFAFEDSKAFKEIEEILVQRVKAGVEVKIIYDDFGSLGYFKKDFLKRLRTEGIDIRAFNPIVPIVNLFVNNRDHRKYTIIDGKLSFSGGYNMCDEYFNYTHPYGYWKDCGIIIRGEAVRNHTIMFLAMWEIITGKALDASKYLEAQYEVYNDGILAPFTDSPLDNETVGENVYLNIIRNAKRYVYIYTPYLIIDNEMMELLCLASKSGVDVRIVTPGIPDKKLVYSLTKSYYPQLLDSNVKIYHYTPGFIHAKCFICDDEVGVVGSINMDYRSLYLHYECGTFMYKTKSIEAMKVDFLDTFSKSEEVHPSKMRKRPKGFGTLVQELLRLFAPLM